MRKDEVRDAQRRLEIDAALKGDLFARIARERLLNIRPGDIAKAGKPMPLRLDIGKHPLAAALVCQITGISVYRAAREAPRELVPQSRQLFRTAAGQKEGPLARTRKGKRSADAARRTRDHRAIFLYRRRFFHTYLYCTINGGQSKVCSQFWTGEFSMIPIAIEKTPVKKCESARERLTAATARPIMKQ